MFNRDAEKETVNILLRENKKLKRDNQRLRESLGELERYKKEYRDLITKWKLNTKKNWKKPLRIGQTIYKTK